MPKRFFFFAPAPQTIPLNLCVHYEIQSFKIEIVDERLKIIAKRFNHQFVAVFRRMCIKLLK